jgi:hypothetical protein
METEDMTDDKPNSLGEVRQTTLEQFCGEHIQHLNAMFLRNVRPAEVPSLDSWFHAYGRALEAAHREWEGKDKNECI